MRKSARSKCSIALIQILSLSCQVDVLDNKPAIYGGRKPKEGTPEVLSTATLISRGGQEGCSGTLVSPRLVVTAGHCLEGGRPVAVGFGPNKTGKTKVKNVLSLGSPSNGNDLALLQLVSPVPKPFVPTPILGNAEVIKPGMTAILAGYGWSSWGRGGGVLRSVEKTIEGFRNSGKIVTFNQKDGTGACHGDSGGPAYVHVEGRWYVIGATSGPVDLRGGREPDCNQVISGYTFLPRYLGVIKEKSAGLYTEDDHEFGTTSMGQLALECPEGYTWDGHKPYCRGNSRNGILEIIGFLPEQTQEKCEGLRGGAVCRELHSFMYVDGEKIMLLRYSQTMIDGLVTEEGCFHGLKRDPKLFNLCRDGQHVYGPFGKDLVTFCIDKVRGGTACRSNRMTVSIVEDFKQNSPVMY